MNSRLFVASPAPLDSDADEYEYFQPFQSEVNKTNWTAVDNRVIEEFQPLMPPHAFCVLLHFIRLTTGYHVDRVQISISQLEDRTGFSRPTVIKAIEILTSAQLPCLRVVHPGDRVTAATYGLNTGLRCKRLRHGRRADPPPDSGQDDLPQVVKEIDHPGKNDLPQVVKEIDRSKERSKKDKINSAAPGTGASGRPTPLSELEREGYSPNPPTQASRYPARPSLPAFLPLSLKAMEMTPEAMRAAAALPPEEAFPPARYHMDERGVPRPREEAARLWMLAVLGIACGVQLRTGLDDSAADALWPLACDLAAEGVTPPQMWVAFADRAGYWWASEEHAWKKRPPTAGEARAKWRAGLEWRPSATPAAASGSGKYSEAELSAWERLTAAANRHGRNSRVADWPELDEVEKRALLRLGFVDFMNRQADDDLIWRKRYVETLRRVQAEPPRPATPTMREPQPVYVAA